MAFEPDSAQLLSRLPTHLTTDLFAGANPVKLAADQVLFLAGDPGDSCYRVELGLLKVTMVSRSGIERILSFIGRGGIVGELAIIDGQLEMPFRKGVELGAGKLCLSISNEPGRRSAAHLLTRDEARRIAANVAKTSWPQRGST